METAGSHYISDLQPQQHESVVSLYELCELRPQKYELRSDHINFMNEFHPQEAPRDLVLVGAITQPAMPTGSRDIVNKPLTLKQYENYIKQLIKRWINTNTVVFLIRVRRMAQRKTNLLNFRSP